MATRRIVSTEKTILDKDDVPSPSASKAGGKSNTAPAVPASVIIKLLGFTLAMIAAPLGTYFLTVNTVFKGSTTWAGATAAIVANLVLVAYVIVAMAEDQSERIEAEKRERKAQ